MQLALLHLDDALLGQHSFMATAKGEKASERDLAPLGARIRLWGRDAALDQVKDALGESHASNDEPVLTFLGSGDFHHVSALLIERSLDKLDQPVTVLHFDNHPDWVGFDGGMHCGSWINRALAHPRVEKLITVGVASGDLSLPEFKGANLTHLKNGRLELYPYRHGPSLVRKRYGAGASHRQEGRKLHWKTIDSIGEEAFIELLLSRIATPAVYITVDKDVLALEDAVTNWDQGHLRMPTLLQWIGRIGARHRIIGADVTGDYSVPHYHGTRWTRTKKRAEIFLDQPKRSLDPAETAALNAAANHALLEAFMGVMA